MIGSASNGWQVKKLSECGKIITGKTPSKAVKEYWNSNDISFIKPDDFTKDTIIEFDKGKDFMSFEGFKKAPKIPPYSVLTTCIGNIGKVLINKNEASTNQQINTIVPSKDVHYKYLAYAILKLKPIMLQKANAPVVPMINKTDFGKYEISVPPLPQQEKIVKVLDISSALIEKQKELIKKYDLFLKSKFIEMFGDPVSNPMGWEVVGLGSLIYLNMGQSPLGETYNTDGIGSPLLNGPAEFGLKFPTEKQYTTAPKKFSKKGDILYCVRGATAGRMNFSDKEYCIGRGLASINNNQNSSLYYVYFILKQSYEYFQKTANGSTFINISKDMLNNYKTLCPPIELQNKFASIVQKTEQIKEQETKKLEHLETLHNSLMDKAFKGEVK